MLLLISSNSSRRYGDDIVRALAHPRGSDFQFRYGLKYFDPALVARATTTHPGGPVRAGLLPRRRQGCQEDDLCELQGGDREAQRDRGLFCILTLSAGGLCRAHVRCRIAREADTAAEQQLLPAWAANPNSPDGKFVIEVDATIQAGRVPKPKDELPRSRRPPRHSASSHSLIPRAGLPSLPSAPSRLRMIGGLCGGAGRSASGRHTRTADSVSAPAIVTILKSTPSRRRSCQCRRGHQIVRGQRRKRDPVRIRQGDHARLALRPQPFHLHHRPAAGHSIAGLTLGLAVPTGGDPKSEQRCDVTLPVSFGGWRVLGIGRVVIIAVGTAAPAIVGILYKDKMSIGIAAIMVASALIAGWASVFLGSKKG